MFTAKQTKAMIEHPQFKVVPTPLPTYHVSYKDRDTGLVNIFVALAEDGNHAIEQYQNAYPQEAFNYQLINAELKSYFYSCRAECLWDVNLFFSSIKVPLSVTRFESIVPDLPDVMVEFVTELTIQELYAILDKQTDSHVMRDTLHNCYLSQNSLHR